MIRPTLNVYSRSSRMEEVTFRTELIEFSCFQEPRSPTLTYLCVVKGQLPGEEQEPDFTRTYNHRSGGKNPEHVKFHYPNEVVVFLREDDYEDFMERNPLLSAGLRFRIRS